MRLLVGPPGSGKTHWILERFRAALRAGRGDARVLVPTATMGEHLRNSLAREGFVIRPGHILSLSKFAAAYAEGTPQVSAAALRLIIDEVLERLRPEPFASVIEFPGFRESLASAIEELSSWGCGAADLAGLASAGRLEGHFIQPFLAVLEAVERELSGRSLHLRHGVLRRAAETVRRDGLNGVSEILIDGFFSFAPPELDLIRAMTQWAEVTVTLPEWHGASLARAEFASMGAEEILLSQTRRTSREILVAPPTREQEVDEIARRILSEAAAGRRFREIGVVVRTKQPYVPALETAFRRFGIPARFYFSEPLAGHAAVRYLTGLVEAMRGGWNHEELLPLLQMTASGLGGTPEGDRLEIRIRESLPGAGLETLRPLGAPPIFLDRMAVLESWRDRSLTPREWPGELGKLRALVAPPDASTPPTPELVPLWRAHAAALDALDAALYEAADLLGTEPVSFDRFWEAASEVIDLGALRVNDHRHNVVHVMDVFEARQWELPVVFVCGLLEGEFPNYGSQDALLPDSIREGLGWAGYRIRTTADRQIEEEFLFEVAATRAAELTVFSYPRFNAKGEETLPSFFLDGRELRYDAHQAVRPAPPRRRAPARAAVIYDEALRERIAERHRVWRPTAIESFLQCPYQFFGRYTLRLQSMPARPEDRLDAPLQGTLIHDVLAEWARSPQPIEPLFQRRFERLCRENNVRQGYATELARLDMLRNLMEFAEEPRIQEGWQIHVEREFRLEIAPEVEVRGRIDRYDVAPDNRAVIFDYKYSSDSGLRRRIEGQEENRYVQGGLYLIAVEGEHKPAGFFYCGLRGKPAWRGWEGAEELRGIMTQARELTIDAARRVRDGHIAVEPADENACGYCEFHDACRIRTIERAMPAAEGSIED